MSHICRFGKGLEFSRLQILDPFVSTITIETESGTMKTPGENLTAVSASLQLFAPAARYLSSDFYHCGVDRTVKNLTRFKIAAQTLMTFAGNFFYRRNGKTESL